MEVRKIDIHNRNLSKRLETFNKLRIDPTEKKKIPEFLGDLAIGKVSKGKSIGESTQLKYLEFLTSVLKYFNRNFNTLTLNDVEKFIRDLDSDVLVGVRGAWDLETKLKIKLAFCSYVSWRLPAKKAKQLTDWIDRSKPKQKDPDSLSEFEVDKLFRSCSSSEQRFLVAVLFDSGARAEEFHNIRFSDIEMPQGKNNFVKLTLRSEFSKTKGRTVSLYWKNSLSAVGEYLNERKKEGIAINEPVFKNRYDNARQILNRLGARVLNKRVYYHLFRHSSATYYATRLNRQELCYRYGWRFSSDMPDIYISRAGMTNSKLDENFTSTELGELKGELEKEKHERKLTQEKTDEKMKKMIQIIRVAAYGAVEPTEEQRKEFDARITEIFGL